MQVDPSPSEAIQAELAELIEDFLARQARGETPSVDEYIARRPDLEPTIRDLFSTMCELRQVGSSALRTGRGIPSHLGEYRLLREIGRGGMGVVFEAIQEPLGRRVALKVISDHGLQNAKLLARFQQEARTAAALHHSNIVSVFGYGDFDGTPFFAMQFLSGTTLADQIRAWRYRELAESDFNDLKGPARVAQVVAWVIQIGEALHYAHQLGVIHRDVKPGNILVDERGTAFLVDFGLSKLRDGDQMTLTGTALGTPRYLAPERLRGDESALSDVYALGATLYELLALQPAFPDEQRDVVLAKVQRGEFPGLRGVAPDVPKDLDVIVGKAMAFDPRQRYASAAAMVEDLQLFCRGAPIRARPLRAWARGWRWARRNPALAATATALAASLLVGIVSTTWLWRRADALRITAEKNAELAGEQTEIARDRLAKTLAMVQIFHNELFDNVRFAALGFEQTRRKLLQTTLDHYLELAAAGENQPEFQLALADLEAAVADTKVMSGDAKSAEAHYAAALQRHRQLRARYLASDLPLPPEYERAFLTTLLKECRYYYVFDADKLGEAIPQTQAQIEQFRAANPADPFARHAAAILAAWSATRGNGESVGAIDQAGLRDAIRTLEELHNQRPEDAQLLMDLAEMQLRLVHGLLHAQPDDAQEHLDAIQPRLEVFVADEPQIMYFRYLLAEAYRLRAWLLAARGDWSDYDRVTLAAQQHSAAVDRRFGNSISRFVQQRADIHGLRGNALYNRDRQASRREYDAQVERCRQIQDRSEQAATAYGVALTTLTNRFGNELGTAESIRHLSEAISVLQAVVQRAPKYARARSELAAAMNNLGMLQLEQGELETAEHAFRDAIENQTAALAVVPTLPHALEFLGNHHLNLGRLRLRQGVISQAIAELAAAAECQNSQADSQWGLARELAQIRGAYSDLTDQELEALRRAILNCIDRAWALGDRDPARLEHPAFALWGEDPEFQERRRRVESASPPSDL